MRKYLILTTILALCACNKGGGHGGGASNYNVGSSGVSNGASITKPSEQPGNEAPIETSKQMVITTSNALILDTPLQSKQTRWRMVGNIDTEADTITTNQIISKGGLIGVFKCEESQCNRTYKKGEYYYGYSTGEQRLNQVNDYDTMAYIKNGQEYTEYCRDDAGCIIPDSTITLKLSEFVDGEYYHEFTDDEAPEYKRIDRVVFGAETQNIPLHYSNFGYWNNQIFDPEFQDSYTKTFIAGDSDKEVFMKTLAEIKEIDTVQTYSGRAFVGISSTYTAEATEGFIAAGDAKLTFDANAGTPEERLLMNFSDAGWYNVFVKGDGTDLRFFGNANVDDKFRIKTAPKTATDINIHYYGDNTLTVAEEAVGDVIVQDVQMEDNLKRDINFSFGAVKD